MDGVQDVAREAAQSGGVLVQVITAISSAIIAGAGGVGGYHVVQQRRAAKSMNGTGNGTTAYGLDLSLGKRMDEGFARVEKKIDDFGNALEDHMKDDGENFKGIAGSIGRIDGNLEFMRKGK